MALALADALPGRCSLSTCTCRCDSTSVPLLRFNSPSRLEPESVVPRLSAQDCSHGFLAPTTFEDTRVHGSFSRKELAKASTTVPQSSHIQRTGQGLREGPKPPATAPLTGFRNLSATCSSRYHATIFRWLTLLGLCPPGTLSVHEASSNSSPLEYPLVVTPSGCAAQGPRPGLPPARGPT